jgi:hypothetical protein
MPNKKGQEKVVNNIDLEATVEPTPIILDEKVEVFIKEIIRINPKDFQAFKHALEDFVKDWDK